MRRGWWLALALMPIASGASALDESKGFAHDWWRGWYVAGSVGSSGNSVKGSGSVENGVAGYPDDYSVESAGRSTVVGLEVGRHTERAASGWLAGYDVGVGYYTFGRSKVSGLVDQYSLPGFDNYAYDYSLSVKEWLLMGRLELYRWSGLGTLEHQIALSPVITAGLGLATSQVSGYSETPTAGVWPVRVSPEFSGSHTEVIPVYGLGVKATVGSQLWLLLQAQRQTVSFQASGSNMSLSNRVTNNAIMASVGYEF